VDHGLDPEGSRESDLMSGFCGVDLLTLGLPSITIWF
jgi:hypothetical protein